MSEDITLSITPDINFSAFSRTDSTTNLSIPMVDYGGADTRPIAESGKAEEDDELSSYEGGSPYFDRLPDEIMLKVLGYLDPMALIKVGMVDKRFKELSDMVSLWDKVSFGKQWKPHSAINADTYRRSYKQFYLDQKAAEARRKQQLRNQQLRRRRDRFASIMLHTVFNKLGEWLCYFCLLTFTITCVLKLDDIIQAPWPTVMIPVYIATFILFINPFMLCAFSCASDYYDFRDELKEGEECYSPVLFVPAILHFFRGTREERVIPFWTFLIQFVLFIVLSSVKLGGANISWFAALWPVMSLAVCCTLCMFLCDFRCWKRENNFPERAAIIPVFIGVIVFSVFLALQLDMIVCWSWHVVFAPAYATILFCGINLLMSYLRRRDNCLRTNSWLKGAYGMFAVLFMIPTPVFLGLLAANLNGTFDAKWATVFVPVWVFDALCFAVYIILDVTVV